MTPSRIPVTVIGGYLGAGKTTLLNQLLRQGDGRRLAVLVNDFGSINIDAELIARQNGDTISLTNGCVCCSIQDNLGTALYELARAAHPPDQIVIEASGVANPLRLAQYARGTPGLELDGMVVLADTETVRERADDRYVGATVRRQLEAADLLILTKVDLVSAERITAVRDWLRGAVPEARVVEAVRGRIPVDLVLGVGRSTGGGEAAPTTEAPPPEPREHDAAHTAAFATFSLTAERAFDRPRLAAALDALPPALVRAKGILYLADDPTHRVVLQVVGKRWELERGEPWGESARQSRLVLIGVADQVNWENIVQRLVMCS